MREGITMVIVIAISVIIAIAGICKIVDIANESKTKKEKYGAIKKGYLKHIEGLPLAGGVFVDAYYCPDKIIFVKENQEISVAINKIVSIDCTQGSDIKSQKATGAIAGKYILGGLSGAIIGSLAASTTYFIITYKSDDGIKYIIFDVDASSNFAYGVAKDFKQNYCNDVNKIELWYFLLKGS